MMSPWISASLASRSIGVYTGTAARKQFFPRNARAFGLDLCPQGLGFLGSPLQIGPHFLLMPKVVGDCRMDVGQHQGVVGTDHLFRRHAVFVLLDDQVEADASRANAD